MTTNDFSDFIPDEAFSLCLYERFRYDTWYLRDALCLMLGINPNLTQLTWPLNDNDPESYVVINAYVPPDGTDWIYRNQSAGNRMPYSVPEDEQQNLLYHEYELDDLRRLWLSNPDNGSGRYSPLTFIDWAIKKRIPILWLQWAIDNELFDTESGMSQNSESQREKSELPPKTRTTLLRIIAGLSHQYLTNPDVIDKPLGGLNKIISILDGVGMTVDSGKLSEYVGEAKRKRIEVVTELEAAARKMERERKNKLILEG